MKLFKQEGLKKLFALVNYRRTVKYHLSSVKNELFPD